MTKNFLPTTVLWLSCISISTTLSASTICRNALYLAAAIAIIDLIIKRPRIKWDINIAIPVAILLLSISFYLPTQLMKSSLLGSIDSNYIETSKRILIGAIICFYLRLTTFTLSKKNIQHAYTLIFIGFLYTVFVALRISINSLPSRLDINTVSTMSAYVFAVQSLATIFVLLKIKHGIRSLLVILTISVSLYIIVLTQTRSVLLTYPIIVLAFLYREKFFNVRSLYALFIILSISTIFALPQIKTAMNRVASSVNEIHDYKNNDDNTSLGARFSMWKAGLSAFKTHPWGESADQRNLIAKKYILEHENSNPEALISISYHYHNDILEAASLRGIIGVIVLLTFYITVIITAYKITGTVTLFLLLMLPTLLYGCTDSLFIDSRYVTIFILLIPFYLNEKIIKTNHHLREN